VVLPRALVFIGGFGNQGVGGSIGLLMRYFAFAHRVFLLVVFVLLMHYGAALALQPDEIALIVNSNEPAGRQLADFYAQARHIPDNRILELSLPTADEISFQEYEDTVVPQVREFLRTGNLEHQVKCFVTFFGVPLRIAPREANLAESREQTGIRQELLKAAPRVTTSVQELETLAEQLNPGYTPFSGAGDFDTLRKRAERAAREIAEQSRTVPNARRRIEIVGQMYEMMEPLLGQPAEINRLAIDEALEATVKDATSRPADQQKVQALKDDYQNALKSAAALEEVRYELRSRAQLRVLVFKHFGLFGYVHLLQDQVDYLEPKDSGAAFDNELALVHWVSYNRTRWLDNPLYYLAKPSPGSITYMVMRLDAPRPEQVKALITASIKAENEGLKGKVVIDSRGIELGHEKESEAGMAPYDQSLRDLGDLIRKSTKLELLEDDKPEPLPANSANDVALYCGWYSVRHYIPECKFNPGAVGYHIASYELISLHTPGETGWVAGLLNDGVAGTLGPVAEPYLQAFPAPDEFFPLLLTGRLTLAEVYWKTTRMTSWMMDAIGDPLYTPFKVNPALGTDDLPDRLQRVFTEPATTQP
jgi:uncharacterized protein (TIGR03790 family)